MNRLKVRLQPIYPLHPLFAKIQAPPSTNPNVPSIYSCSSCRNRSPVFSCMSSLAPRRTPILHEWVRPALHAYLAVVARDAGCNCFRAEVWPTTSIWPSHGATVSVAQLVEVLKHPGYRILLKALRRDYDERLFWGCKDPRLPA